MSVVICSYSRIKDKRLLSLENYRFYCIFALIHIDYKLYNSHTQNVLLVQSCSASMQKAMINMGMNIVLRENFHRSYPSL